MKYFQPKFLFGTLLAAIMMLFTINYAYSDQQAAQPVNHIVEITGFKFIPETLNLSAGDSVTWVNKDTSPHSVINSADKKPISPTLMQGEKFTYLAKQTMDYHCGFHTTMLGKVVSQ